MEENTVKEEGVVEEETTTKEETADAEATVEEAVAEEAAAEETVAEEEATEEPAEEEPEEEETAAEEPAEEEPAAEETAAKEEAETEEPKAEEENVMSESEYIEAAKESLKKNLRTWTGVLIFLIVVGLPLCLVAYGVLMVAMFVVNLLFYLRTKKFLQSVENGEADVKDIYEFYESMGRRSVKLFALNLLCGGLFGVIGTVSDMKTSQIGMIEGEKILGDDYKNERIAQDANAKWKYCIYCKRNKQEAFYHLYKLSDGVICSDCLSPYNSMFPKRGEDPLTVKAKGVAHYVSPSSITMRYSSKDLEERLEYLEKNKEEYADFTPTKVTCDGCLEIDEKNSLFRIVPASEFDSGRAGGTSGLVHKFSELKGIAYEMIYEYDTPSESDSGGWRYTYHNSLVFALDHPYLNAETLTLKQIPTKFFSISKKPQLEYAEQTVNELHEIFNTPVLPFRKVHR
jgi:hypothetical protein